MDIMPLQLVMLVLVKTNYYKKKKISKQKSVKNVYSQRMLKLFTEWTNYTALSVNFINLPLLTIATEIAEWAVSGGHFTVMLWSWNTEEKYIKWCRIISLSQPKGEKINCHPKEPLKLLHSCLSLLSIKRRHHCQTFIFSLCKSWIGVCKLARVYSLENYFYWSN